MSPKRSALSRPVAWFVSALLLLPAALGLAEPADRPKGLPSTPLPSWDEAKKALLERPKLVESVRQAESRLAKAESDVQAAKQNAEAKADELRRCLAAPKPKPEVVVREVTKEVVKPDPKTQERLAQAEKRADDAAKLVATLRAELDGLKKPLAPPPVPRPAPAPLSVASAANYPAPGSTLPRDCDVCPVLVVLPKGSYLRGSPDTEKEHDSDEGPVKTVSIGYSLAVGKYEVTFAEWDACVADNKACERPDDQWGRQQQPVMRVSWNQITQQYLPWLNRKAGFDKLDKKYQYRLLTEAEWEYAARGVTSVTAPHPPFPAMKGAHFANASCIHTDDANYDGTVDYANCGAKTGVWRKATVPVQSTKDNLKENLFGLYNMAGNVWEWTQDCYVDKYAGVPVDGSPAAETANCLRVWRGGSWDNDPRRLRAADRYRVAPVNLNIFVGFRLTRMLP